MNVVDIIIVILILFGALLGFKRGFTKEVICFVGFIIVVIASFMLKNTVSIWMYKYLPFFSYGGVLKGVSVINIIVYEVVAFIVVFIILQVLLRVLLFIFGIFEKILDFTIILGFFSKILGAIVGAMEYFVFVFILLYILSLPIFNISIVNESKYRNEILNKTPILSGYIDDSLEVIDKFVELKDKYEVTGTANEFNLEALDLFLEYKVITVENVDMLVAKNKLNIDNIESVLSKYREE